MKRIRLALERHQLKKYRIDDGDRMERESGEIVGGKGSSILCGDVDLYVLLRR